MNGRNGQLRLMQMTYRKIKSDTRSRLESKVKWPDYCFDYDPTSYFKQKGGFISEKVDLHEFMDTGRGVIAKQQIFNLEKIIKISHKLVITGTVAKIWQDL